MGIFGSRLKISFLFLLISKKTPDLLVARLRGGQGMAGCAAKNIRGRAVSPIIQREEGR